MTLTQINKAGLDEIALDHVFTIGASGTDHYTFQGEGLNGTVNDPTLYLTRGKTYRFENGTGAHAIRIQSADDGTSGTLYNTGVTNNNTTGTVIVEVQHDAPDVLYYQCASHANMKGTIYITGALADGNVTTAKIADDAVTDAKLANSINSAIAANTAKTTNATHTGDVTGSTSLTIANDAVTTAKIASGAVTGTELAGNIAANKLEVNDAHIIIGDASNDGALQTLSGDVTMTRTGAVTIGNNAVTAAKITDGAVSGVKIASGGVTSSQIADQAVTLTKLEHGTSSNNGKFLRANNGADPTFETVSTTPADGSITQAKVNFPVANRNLVMNGGMRVAQRGTSSTYNGYKTIDRFYHSHNGTDEACTVSQADVNSSDSGENPYAKGITKSLKITNGNQTSAETADYMRFVQIFEAADIRNSGWDYNSTSSYITLSFYVKSSVAQNFYGILFTQDGSTKMFTFETGSLTANTWKRVTVSIPGASGIQFDDNVSQGLFIYWWAYNGTAYANASNTSNSLNQWSAFYSNARTPVFPTTWWYTNDATYEVTGIQLEVGSVATEFEQENYGTTLAKCQRYYYKHEIASGENGPYFTQYHSGHKFVHDFFPVTMRTVPTSSVGVQSGSTSNATHNPYHLTPNHFKSYIGSSYTDGDTHYITSANYSADL